MLYHFHTGKCSQLTDLTGNIGPILQHAHKRRAPSPSPAAPSPRPLAKERRSLLKELAGKVKDSLSLSVQAQEEPLGDF